jgi:para-nitrobenzyl esterase
MALDDGVHVFQGIPYAAAPIGANRFREPQPPVPWTGVRDAFAYGPTAPKAPYAAPFDVLLAEVDIPGEEYLNLNVWTPDTSGRAPVMVFIHGGAFSNGTSAGPVYDGANFARRGVVLVTLNYRLGVEGFGFLPGVPANLGLQDQVAALTWVRDHIAGFGGDPDRVTVFGQSAGAMGIGALLAMPAAAGLFHRAILQSGAAHHAITPATARLMTGAAAERLGVAPTREAFGDIPMDRLLAVQQQLRAEVSADPDPAKWGEVALYMMPFEPVIDGTVLPADPRAATVDVELLVGSNSEEFNLYIVPTGLIDLIPESAVHFAATCYGLDPDDVSAAYGPGKPGDILSRVTTDWFWRIPAIRLAESATKTAYMYEFAVPSPEFHGRLGACHAAELPFVFDNLAGTELRGLLGPTPPQQVADAMHAAWIAFATTGDPGWRAYDRQTRTTMRFGAADEAALEVVDDPRSQERRLWDGKR